MDEGIELSFAGSPVRQFTGFTMLPSPFIDSLSAIVGAEHLLTDTTPSSPTAPMR